LRFTDHPTVRAYEEGKIDSHKSLEILESAKLKQTALDAGADDAGLIDLSREAMTDYRKDLLDAMTDKQPNQEEIPVFGELAVQWFEMRQGKLKKATIRDFRNSLNNFLLPEFGNTPINQITAFDIEVFVNKLNVRLKRAQNLVCPMRNVFKMAKKAGYLKLERDPFLDVDLKDNTIKNLKPKPNPFSKEEVSLIIANIDPFYKNLSTVLFYTGMRLSEMAGLQWRNVNFKDQVLRIEKVMVEGELDRPKTDESQRDIQMLPMVIGALRDQRRATWGRSKFVFLNMADRPVNPTAFNHKIWSKVCAKTGIRYRPVKNTRSTYISMMLDAGADMGWVAKQVGHTSFKMIYEHYYKYMKKDDPSDKILAYFEQDETKSPEKLVQSGYTDQDELKNKQ